MTRALTALFAIGSGVAVGNLYYAQPLLETIARELRSGAAMTGLLITATQIGYAVGILLIVPLGDFRERRILIPFMMLLSAAALVLCCIVALGLALMIRRRGGASWPDFRHLLEEPSNRIEVIESKRISSHGEVTLLRCDGIDYLVLTGPAKAQLLSQKPRKAD